MSDLPAFEAAADAGFEKVSATYRGRGAQYGDTWGIVEGLYCEDERTLDAWSLIRVKMLRSLYTGGRHRDSIVDLIAYALSYLTWADETRGSDWGV